MTKIINLISPYLRPQTEEELEASMSSLAAALARHFGVENVGVLTSRRGQRSARLNGWFPATQRDFIRDQVTALLSDGTIHQAFSAAKLQQAGLWLAQPIFHHDSMLGMLLLALQDPTPTQSAEIAFVAGQLGAQLRVCQLHGIVRQEQKTGDSVRGREARELAFYAQYDPLTRLNNRKSFEQFISQKIADNSSKRHWLFWVDLLEFNRINQGFGFQCGDDVLIEVAGRLQRVLGTGNGLARVAGDGFGVVIDGDQARSEPEAQRIAEQLIAAVAHPMQWGELSLPLKCSIGIVSFPQKSHSARQLLDRVEQQSKAAADRAVNSIQFAEAMTPKNRSREMLIEAQINESLNKGQFELYFQPKIAIASGQLVGAEALLRWHHGDKGPMTPDAFIEIAERGGQISQLGRWVLREACRRLRQWRDAGYKEFSLAVNLSPKQLHCGDLVADVASALREFSLPPNALVLELTESTALSDNDTMRMRIEELKKLGVKLAIDDFGIGFSGLNTLKSIPAEIVKIDRSFIAELTRSDVDQAIVESVIQMAHRLGKVVVAEGVETLAQMQFLQQAGCDQAQGYFIRPALAFAPFNEFLELWVAERSAS